MLNSKIITLSDEVRFLREKSAPNIDKFNKQVAALEEKISVIGEHAKFISSSSPLNSKSSNF